jgi:hypothetical protein
MDSVGGTLRSKIAKVSAGLTSAALLGGAAFCIGKSMSIESIKPDEMFRRLRRAPNTTVREKLVEEFPFLTKAEIDECRTAGATSGEFTFTNVDCEKALQNKVVTYCIEQEIMKSRLLAIGIVLLIVSMIIIGTVSAASMGAAPAAGLSEDNQAESDASAGKSSPMTVAITALAAFGLFALAAFLLFNRIKVEPFKSEIVKKIYADFRTDGQNIQALLTNESIDFQFKSDPLTRNNTFPTDGDFYHHVRTCARTRLNTTVSPTVITRTGINEDAALESCRALEYATYDEIVSDYKNKELFVVWGFVAFLASYVVGSVAFSKYKTMS